MDRRLLLRELTFGGRVAEEEGDKLDAYFVETDQWHRIVSGKVDVVFGAKGSGKSAIYNALVHRTDALFDEGTLLVPGVDISDVAVDFARTLSSSDSTSGGPAMAPSAISWTNPHAASSSSSASGSCTCSPWWPRRWSTTASATRRPGACSTRCATPGCWPTAG